MSEISEGADEPRAPKKKREPKAAKPKVAAIDPAVPLELRWNLHDLPSSQHRAGLAGLALSVRFLARSEHRGTCRADVDAAGLTLVVDRDGMQALFDEVYLAAKKETLVKTKWAGAEPKRIDEIEVKDEKSGKVKREKRFVYDKVEPAGALIADLDQGTPKLWLKLWQDLVWSTLRGVPAQREPYNARANERPLDDGGEEWDVLAEKPESTVELSSTYALGIQDKTAENAPIEDVARLRFLLHFWPMAISIYVPAILQRDGKRDFVGYAVAVPDVAALDEFIDVWEAVARARATAPLGFYPRDAVIDLAAEAGLDVVRRCNEIVAANQGASRTRRYLAAIDVFHLQKEGNNTRMRSVGRIVPTPPTDTEYARVRAALYWSPVFRRQRVSNVLDRRPWWHGFARLCAITSDQMTIRHTQFTHDCKAAFTEIEMKVDTEAAQPTLEQLIYSRVRSYVLGKLKMKYEHSWRAAKGDPSKESDYNDKKEKVAREAFLAVRARSGADFVAYFTSTICSIPAWTNEAAYLEVARALMDPNQVEKVRSLTLLALSAIA